MRSAILGFFEFGSTLDFIYTYYTGAKAKIIRPNYDPNLIQKFNLKCLKRAFGMYKRTRPTALSRGTGVFANISQKPNGHQ